MPAFLGSWTERLLARATIDAAHFEKNVVVGAP